MRLSLVAALLVATLGPPASAAEKSEKQVAKALKRCAPATYDAALDCLDKFLPADNQKALAAPEGAIAAHFGLGMFLRNNWGLWKQGPLYRSMSSMGFTHPDDMSGAILDGFSARERGESFRPVPPDPAKVQAQWDQAVKEGRAGSLSCDMPPLPKKPTKKQVRAATELCFDQMAKSLEGDLK
jgi:hypothetical protein